MNRKFGVTVACSLLVIMLASAVSAAPLFVATAKNLRGALYLGYGPTPKLASEQAVVKCSQDSLIPPTCKVVCVRAECAKPPCLGPQPTKMPTKVKKLKPFAYKPYAKRGY